MKMKKNVLSAAVLAALSVGSAHAVNLSQTGTGEVLIFPYYTVQNGEETLLSVVNTTNQFKAVKVRFREGMNSREVLDFNLYLSPYDVWTAKVMDNGSNGAKIVTNDKSCTVPGIAPEGVDFRTFDFDGSKAVQKAGADGGPIDASRTREGYVEVLEMGVAAPFVRANSWDRDNNNRNDAKHYGGVGNSVPDNCVGLRNNFASGGVWNQTTGNANMDMRAPTGGIFGSGAIINVGTGTEFSVEPTVLEAFSDVPQHTAPGSLLPHLAAPSPSVSVVMLNNGVNDSVQVITDRWQQGEDAVSALLQARSVVNEYTVNPAVEAETDWVITFPTKHYYADLGLNASTGRAPFTTNFTQAVQGNPFQSVGRACEPVSRHYWDREENEITQDVDFSPAPQAGSFDLCNEVNVLQFGNSDTLSSVNLGKVFGLEAGYNSGWSRLTFDAPAQALHNGHNLVNESSYNVYPGLPAIGFRATRLLNGNVGIGAAYAVSDTHKYRKYVVDQLNLKLEEAGILYGVDSANNYGTLENGVGPGNAGIEEGGYYPANLAWQWDMPPINEVTGLPQQNDGVQLPTWEQILSSF